MALKAVLKSLDGLNEELQKLYVKKGDQYELDTEGIEEHSSAGALKRAYDAEKAKRKEAADKLSKFGDVTPEEVTAALEAVKKQKMALVLKGREVKTEEDLHSIVEELLNERVTEATKAWEKEKATLVAESGKLKTRLEAREIDSVFMELAAKKGVRKTAIPDVLYRARSIFKLTDDGVVPMQGDKVLYGKDPKSPMSGEEWMDKLVEDAPHLFEESTGGGSRGNGGKPPSTTSGGKIVYTKDDLASGRASIDKIAKGEAIVQQ